MVHEGADKTCQFIFIRYRFAISLITILGTHEQQSLQMIEHLISTNNIKLHDSPKTHKFALTLITSLITGDSKMWKKILKPEEMFVTQIVSNKFCNIDVDKLDYILRDHEYVKQFVELKPFINFIERAKIVKDESGTTHIAYHYDDFELIENMFYNRAYLHMNIYQFPKVAGTERMVKDICVKASAGGVTIDNLPLTEVHMDDNAFLKLDDTVLDLIESSGIDNNLVHEAQSILTNLYERRFYDPVWESNYNESNLLEDLEKKFGSVFCKVEKFIPSAEVPKNIPLYKNDEMMEKSSDLRLSYKSNIIYCVKPDEVLINNIRNFIDSMNNNVCNI